MYTPQKCAQTDALSLGNETKQKERKIFFFFPLSCGLDF